MLDEHLQRLAVWVCERPLRLLDEEQAALNGAPVYQVDPAVKQITATLSDPNFGRSGLTCRHCHGSSHQSSARFQPHPTLDVTSLKAQPDEGLTGGHRSLHGVLFAQTELYRAERTRHVAISRK